jgi:hypothetical protein
VWSPAVLPQTPPRPGTLTFPAAIRHFENNSYGSDWQKTWLLGQVKYVEGRPDVGLHVRRVSRDTDISHVSVRSFSRAEEGLLALLSEPVQRVQRLPRTPRREAGGPEAEVSVQCRWRAYQRTLHAALSRCGLRSLGHASGVFLTGFGECSGFFCIRTVAAAAIAISSVAAAVHTSQPVQCSWTP